MTRAGTARGRRRYGRAAALVVRLVVSSARGRVVGRDLSAMRRPGGRAGAPRPPVRGPLVWITGILPGGHRALTDRDSSPMGGHGILVFRFFRKGAADPT